MKVPAPTELLRPIHVPQKLLMGPGPTNCSPRVLKACSLELAHMHEEYYKIMDDVKAGLKYVFQTENPWTLIIPGPGHLGMEVVMMNLLEPGDKVLIGVCGLWGIRATNLAKRIDANPVAMETELGRAFSLRQIEEALKKHKPKMLFLVHSESSTGVMQPLIGVGDLCRQHDCLLVVDTVAALGGVPFYLDDWKIDAAYAGSQKILGAPPGMSPVSFSPRAVKQIKSRKIPVKSFVLDMNELATFWQCNDPSIPRAYHVTPATNLMFAMREALSEIVEEGLANRWNRHAVASAYLHSELKKMGLELFVKNPEDRLPVVTTVKIPEGVDWKKVIKYVNDRHRMEIGGGLGPTVGMVFRIGTLGYNAYPEKVQRALRALQEGLEFAKIKSRL